MPESTTPTVSIVPAPLDALVIRAVLDGRDGRNRATGQQAQIAATTDLDALRAWLARFTDTKTTFENYRKEAERLLLWAIVQLG
jgi:integrase/recombinase XerD